MASAQSRAGQDRLVVCCVVAVTVAVAACTATEEGARDTSAVRTQGVDTAAYIPECHHDWAPVIMQIRALSPRKFGASQAGAAAVVIAPRDSGVQQAPGPAPALQPGDSGQIWIAGNHTNVNEYHDCQRLLSEDEKTYGPLVAIFASKTLDELDPTAPRVSAAAQILNLDQTRSYTPLDIRPYYSCLYLWRDATNDNQWTAKMVSYGLPEPDCKQEVDPTSLPGTTLDVVATRVARMDDDDYPPVARWDWDGGTAKAQLIGIKCGAAWCEVGPRGFKPGNAHSKNGGGSNKTRRVVEVKGWYDEQRLGENASPGAPTTPAAIRGYFIPHPQLGDYSVATFNGKWIPVARVELAGSHGQYKKKFGFDRIGSARRNTIDLCRGSRTQCGVSGSAQSCNDPTTGKPSDWWARITAPNGREIFRCVMRRPAPAGVKVPGTARWRWLQADETGWFRCADGCCEMHGDQ